MIAREIVERDDAGDHWSERGRDAGIDGIGHAQFAAVSVLMDGSMKCPVDLTRGARKLD